MFCERPPQNWDTHKTSTANSKQPAASMQLVEAFLEYQNTKRSDGISCFKLQFWITYFGNSSKKHKFPKVWIWIITCLALLLLLFIKGIISQHIVIVCTLCWWKLKIVMLFKMKDSCADRYLCNNKWMYEAKWSYLLIIDTIKFEIFHMNWFPFFFIFSTFFFVIFFLS